MKRNLSRPDRWTRATLSLALALAAVVIGMEPIDRAMLLAVAVAVAGTALAGRCPLYTVYGVSSVGGLHREAGRCLIGGTGGCSPAPSPPSPSPQTDAPSTRRRAPHA